MASPAFPPVLIPPALGDEVATALTATFVDEDVGVCEIESTLDAARSPAVDAIDVEEGTIESGKLAEVWKVVC